jgi:hypothetical protein
MLKRISRCNGLKAVGLAVVGNEKWSSLFR